MSAIVIRATLPTKPASAACVIRRTSDGAYLDTTAGTWATVGTLPTNHAVTLTADTNFPDQYRGSLTTTGMAAFGTDLNVDLFVYDAGTSPPTSLVATCDWVKAGDNNLAPATVTLGPSDLTAISDAVIAAGGTTPAAVWGYTSRSLTDKAGYSLTQAFPTHFATLAIDTSGYVTATNGGSGGGSSGTLQGDSGAVSAGSWSPTAFSATGDLNAPAHGYEGMWLFFQTGTQRRTKRLVTGHAVAGSVHSFVFATGFVAAPAQGDTFVIG